MKAIYPYNIKEYMFGHGIVEMEANVETEIPDEVFNAWEFRGYPIKAVGVDCPTCTSPTEDKLEDKVIEPVGSTTPSYQELMKMAKEKGCIIPKSVTKSQLIELLMSKE